MACGVGAVCGGWGRGEERRGEDGTLDTRFHSVFDNDNDDARRRNAGGMGREVVGDRRTCGHDDRGCG